MSKQDQQEITHDHRKTYIEGKTVGNPMYGRKKWQSEHRKNWSNVIINWPPQSHKTSEIQRLPQTTHTPIKPPNTIVNKHQSRGSEHKPVPLIQENIIPSANGSMSTEHLLPRTCKTPKLNQFKRQNFNRKFSFINRSGINCILALPPYTMCQ